MTILVTGTAGFIGNHLALALLERGLKVVGIDNLSDYYDVALKRARLDRLLSKEAYCDERADLTDPVELENIFARHQPAKVVHLAAQAGVRHSLSHPQAYIDSNIVGFQHLLNCCRKHQIAHLVFASTSSVYGANTQMPFRTDMATAHPLSLYAATKKANEVMAHAFSHLHNVPVTGLRFFTVYGPWGRPDMALFKFTEAILSAQPIEIYNDGKMSRDFTYIDDIVESMVRILDLPPTIDANWDGDNPNPGTSGVARYKLFNIGANRPANLMRYIEVLEECLGVKAERRYLPMQPGDVANTWADCEDLAKAIGYRPQTPIEVGVRNFVDWYRDYHRRN